MSNGGNLKGYGRSASVGVLAVVMLVVAGCGTAPSAPAPPALPPQGVVTQVLATANFVFVDGRKVHTTMMNGSVEPDGQCERDADLALARKMLQGQTVSAYRPKTEDASGIAPPDFAQADVFLPSGENYADAFESRYFDNREQRCPKAETPAESTPSASTPSSSSGRDVDVDVDVDRDHHKSRFCRRHWFC